MKPDSASPGTIDLGSKLDALIRLTAVSLLGEKTGGDAIDVLARAGLSNDLIAELVGTTPGSVPTIVHEPQGRESEVSSCKRPEANKRRHSGG